MSSRSRMNRATTGAITAMATLISWDTKARRCSRLSVYFLMWQEVEVLEEVELDGEVGLDGVRAPSGVAERRLAPLCLFPQIATRAALYLIVVDIRSKEVGMTVVDAACDVLDAHAVATAVKQYLNDVAMVDILHVSFISAG